MQFALDSSCRRRFLHTWDVTSGKSPQIIQTTDERWILVFWKSVTMLELDASGERFPGSEQGRWRRWCLILYEKFSVFSYRTSEESYTAVSNVSKNRSQ